MGTKSHVAVMPQARRGWMNDGVHGTHLHDGTESGRTRVHGYLAPDLRDRCIAGPFGPMTLTRAQYYLEVAVEV